jgi:(heptosyl)LPS beta-1,4-glucosyltransferase
MHEDGRRTSLPALLLHGPLAFLRNYLAKGGFRLGAAGAIVSAMNAYYVFLKYAKLWQLQAAPPVRPDQGPRPA